MALALTNERRGVMFEMLRRQNISTASQRSPTRRETEAREAGEREGFLRSALASWAVPGVAGLQPPLSAAVARRDDEFFRAVGA